MKRYLRSLCLLSASFALSTHVGAVTLYGHDDDENLFSIDTDTRTLTLIGDTGSEYIPELQLTPDGSTLILPESPNGSSQIRSFDFGTATTSIGGSVSFPASGVGPGTDWDVVTALEYVGNTLYAGITEAGPEIGPGLLATLDPVTGATTSIGIMGIVGPPGGLAFDGTTMYATSAANSEFSELYTVDLATGAASLVAPITYLGQQVDSMTALVIADGKAYTKSNDDAGGVDKETLYSLDLATGELTEEFFMGEFIVGLTALPIAPMMTSNPTVPDGGTTAALLSLSLLGLLALKKKQ